MFFCDCISTILLTKTTAARNEAALGYRSVRGLYFLAVIFVRSILEEPHISRRNNKSLIIHIPRNAKCEKLININNSVYIALCFCNILVKKLKIPNSNEIVLCNLKRRLNKQKKLVVH